jgi:hypothetical protein
MIKYTAKIVKQVNYSARFCLLQVSMGDMMIVKDADKLNGCMTLGARLLFTITLILTNNYGIGLK